MSKFKAFALPLFMLTLFWAAGASAQWLGIKPALQNEVRIVTETKTRLVLCQPSMGDSLVITSAREYDADIYGAFEVKRGGNPYRVWVATAKFLNSPRFAAAGKKYFRESLLSSLRQDEPMAVAGKTSADSGEMQVETAGTKEMTIENVQAALAASDSLPPPEEKDAPQISLDQPALPETEKILAAASGGGAAGQTPVEKKAWLRHGKNAGKTPPNRPRAEAARAALSYTLLDSLYFAALANLENADWRQAAFNLEKINLLQPNYREVIDLLARARVNLAAAEKPRGETEPRKSGGAYIFVGGATAAIGAFIALIVLPFIGVILISSTARVQYHIFRGQYAKAAQIYEKLLVRRPGKKKFFPALANLYLRLGRRDEAALKVYEMALQLNLADHHREEINSIVSNYYLTKGRTDAGVIAVLEDALKAERLKQKKRKS